MHFTASVSGVAILKPFIAADKKCQSTKYNAIGLFDCFPPFFPVTISASFPIPSIFIPCLEVASASLSRVILISVPFSKRTGSAFFSSIGSPSLLTFSPKQFIYSASNCFFEGL